PTLHSVLAGKNDACRDMGLLCCVAGESVVRFLPPLNVRDSEIEEAIEILDDCLAEWHSVSKPSS
ncbi:MAG: hypothetical protein WCL16_06160, partial [bacterium]